MRSLMPVVALVTFQMLISPTAKAQEIYCKDSAAASKALEGIADNLGKSTSISLMRCAEWEILDSKDGGSNKGMILGIPKDGGTEDKNRKFVDVVSKVHELSKKYHVGVSLRHTLVERILNSAEFSKRFLAKLETVLWLMQKRQVNNIDLGRNSNRGDLQPSTFGINQKYYYGATINIRQDNADFDEDFGALYSAALTSKLVHDATGSENGTPHAKDRPFEIGNGALNDAHGISDR